MVPFESLARSACLKSTESQSVMLERAASMLSTYSSNSNPIPTLDDDDDEDTEIAIERLLNSLERK